MSDGFEEATNTQTRSKHSISKAVNQSDLQIQYNSEVVGTACKIIESVALSVRVRVRVHLSPE